MYNHNTFIPMRPFLSYNTPAAASRRHTSPRRQAPDTLEFSQATVEMLPALLPLLRRAPWRTCDFTAGGLLLWADYFHYTFCIRDNTLFVMGTDEADPSRMAFLMPVGDMAPERAISMVRDYCRRRGMEARFTAVPEEALEAFRALSPRSITELPDWADYLYDAQALASLSGKKLNKKRNHVNRFTADNPGFTFSPVTAANIDAVRDFYNALELAPGKAEMAAYERCQVTRVLADPSAWPFTGAVLSVEGRGPVAFTFGEVKGDTLHVHIEKMDHEVAGAGETVNKLFAAMMTERHPELRFINRQDDAGDPGLRRAKESYHPLELLRKFDVVL